MKVPDLTRLTPPVLPGKSAARFWAFRFLSAAAVLCSARDAHPYYAGRKLERPGDLGRCPLARATRPPPDSRPVSQAGHLCGAAPAAASASRQCEHLHRGLTGARAGEHIRQHPHAQVLANTRAGRPAAPRTGRRPPPTRSAS
jgi:hypothetical protein